MDIQSYEWDCAFASTCHLFRTPHKTAIRLNPPKYDVWRALTLAASLHFSWTSDSPGRSGTRTILRIEQAHHSECIPASRRETCKQSAAKTNFVEKMGAGKAMGLPMRPGSSHVSTMSTVMSSSSTQGASGSMQAKRPWLHSS